MWKTSQHINNQFNIFLCRVIDIFIVLNIYE
jgi:hypothetical protein